MGIERVGYRRSKSLGSTPGSSNQCPWRVRHSKHCFSAVTPPHPRRADSQSEFPITRFGVWDFERPAVVCGDGNPRGELAARLDNQPRPSKVSLGRSGLVTLDNDVSTALWRQREADMDSIVRVRQISNFYIAYSSWHKRQDFEQGVRIRCSRRSVLAEKHILLTYMLLPEGEAVLG